jgi:hypothetical protein
MRMTKTLVTSLALVLGAGFLAAMAQTEWAVEKTLQIGGPGSWDYVTIDPQTHRLYVPRSTHTQVLDAVSGTVLADIPGQKIAHGVTLVPAAGRGFITDGGGDGGIVIFDLKTNAILGTIAAQPDADGIIYDRASGLVLVVSGDKGTLMTLKPDIDPKTGKLEAPLELGGAPEFLAADGAGKVYINLMDKNEVAVVDLKARKVIARWPVAPGGAPVGMSIDTKKKRLFIGCRKPQKLIVMSTEDGKVISDMPIGESVDATKIYNGQAFASCRDGTLVVASETSPGKFTIVQTVKTPPGARTMDIDPTTNKIYLPTAEMEAKSGGKTGTKAGTFMIVVVAPK